METEGKEVKLGVQRPEIIHCCIWFVLDNCLISIPTLTQRAHSGSVEHDLSSSLTILSELSLIILSHIMLRPIHVAGMSMCVVTRSNILVELAPFSTGESHQLNY
jgi:hypothetical protein